MAVSSESAAHKKARFDQIAQIFDSESTPFSVHDVGMGMAHYLGYLESEYPEKQITYSGTDIVPEYVDFCKSEYPDREFHLRDLAAAPGADMHDYVILSGVFHQMRNTKRRDWEAFAYNILENSFKMARKGLAFNMISPYVDFYQPDVYYCDLPKLLHTVRDRMSRFFTIQHNYALFEMTIFVYPEELIAKQNPQEEFAKYFSRPTT